MANRITGKEFEAVKNESYTVIRFKEGRRTMTHGGANLLSALQEVMYGGRVGDVCLVINERQANELGVKIPCASRPIEDYAHLFEIRWEVK
jgi:hypothetical protein